MSWQAHIVDQAQSVEPNIIQAQVHTIGTVDPNIVDQTQAYTISTVEPNFVQVQVHIVNLFEVLGVTV